MKSIWSVSACDRMHLCHDIHQFETRAAGHRSDADHHPGVRTTADVRLVAAITTTEQKRLSHAYAFSH